MQTGNFGMSFTTTAGERSGSQAPVFHTTDPPLESSGIMKKNTYLFKRSNRVTSSWSFRGEINYAIFV